MVALRMESQSFGIIEKKSLISEAWDKKSQTDFLSIEREYNPNVCFNPCSPELDFQILEVVQAVE